MNKPKIYDEACHYADMLYTYDTLNSDNINEVYQSHRLKLFIFKKAKKCVDFGERKEEDIVNIITILGHD